jgi:hypothetical protein
MVEERSAKMEEYGEEWDDKPVCQTITTVLISYYMADLQDDMLMWLMCEAKMSVEDLARRLFLVNLAGLHTTSAASDDIPSRPTVKT